MQEMRSAERVQVLWRVLLLVLWVLSEGVEACHREFVQYYPSVLEEEWVQNIEKWQDDICARVKSPEHEKRINIWLNAADDVAKENEIYGTNGTGSSVLSPPTENKMCESRIILEKQNLDIFSKMEYRYNCPKMSTDLHGVLFNETIEPLAGFLRDPTPICYNNRKGRQRNGRTINLEDKNYIIFSDLKCNTQRLRNTGMHTPHLSSSDRMRPDRIRSPRLIIIDLGATLYGWSLSGPSQKYLLEKYVRSGYNNLYRLIAYEANVYYKAKKIFWGVPPSVIPHYQYFNLPITSEPGSKFNPITLLKALAKPRDFVSLKLDVDNSDIEFSLIEQIISDPSVYGLIDEFFFEHHSNVREFQWAWKDQVKGSMADGYRFFRKMRELGIRAHSWI